MVECGDGTNKVMCEEATTYNTTPTVAQFLGGQAGKFIENYLVEHGVLLSLQLTVNTPFEV